MLVKGEGWVAVVEMLPGQLDFKADDPDSIIKKKFFIQNKGNELFNFDYQVTGDTANFKCNCSGKSVPALRSSVITVDFSPGLNESYSADFNIYSDRFFLATLLLRLRGMDRQYMILIYG